MAAIGRMMMDHDKSAVIWQQVASGQWHGQTIIEITKHVLSKPLVRPCPSSTPRQYYILGTCH